MKGLLYKDLCMVVRCCRSILVMILLFLVMAGSMESTILPSIYPCLFASVLPYTLCAYDEQDGWIPYCFTLPISRAQFVASKYLFSIGAWIAALLLTLAVRLLAFGQAGLLPMQETLSLLLSMGVSTILPFSITMPVVLRFGMERARLVYIILVVLIIAVGLMLENHAGLTIGLHLSPPLAIVAVAVIYAASWLVSVRLLEKREF